MSEKSIGYYDPGEGVSGVSSEIACGQRPKSLSSDNVSVLRFSPLAQMDVVGDEENMLDVRSMPEERSAGLSDDSFGSDASFITVGKKPKRPRGTTAVSAVPYVGQTPDELFEICVISKSDLPKQIALAKLLQAKGVKGILKIKFLGLCKVRIQFNTKEEAEKLLSASEFNNDDRRAFWSNDLNCTYGIVKNVELEVNEEEFLNNIDSSANILSVRRLNRLNNDGRWIKSEVIRLCFKGNYLPPYVYAYGCRFKVDSYVSPVTQCSKCWKFGHLIRFCPSQKIICPKCGGAHANCETTVFKCLNCKGPHMALNKSCPSFLKEKKIKAIMASEGCGYKKALWLYMQEEKKEFVTPSPSSQPSRVELSTGTVGNMRPDKSYRDAVLTKRVSAVEAECAIYSPVLQKSKNPVRAQVGLHHELRKRKKPNKVSAEIEDDDPVSEEPQNVFTDDRNQKKGKRRLSCFERFLEKLKSILRSRDSWQEKLMCVFKFIVEECLGWCKKFVMEFDLFKVFFMNVNG